MRLAAAAGASSMRAAASSASAAAIPGCLLLRHIRCSLYRWQSTHAPHRSLATGRIVCLLHMMMILKKCIVMATHNHKRTIEMVIDIIPHPLQGNSAKYPVRMIAPLRGSFCASHRAVKSLMTAPYEPPSAPPTGP